MRRFCLGADRFVWTSSTKHGAQCLVRRSFILDLINIFEVFLPQLLRYPNPADPLNGDAAALLLREPLGYDRKVREYVKRFANADSFEATDSESQLSSLDDSFGGDATNMEL